MKLAGEEKGNVEMPRQARIDAPGAFHHVISRGIEKRNIFSDQVDREVFLEKLGKSLGLTGTSCYAWALLPNHFHLLLISGSKPVGRVLQSALTSYVRYFNRRHQRNGHLFQNRFKSVLCEKEAYLLELIRYIHLNPLRAGILSRLGELDLYPWSGHSVLMGQQGVDFQEIDDVLSMFAANASEARKGYREFVRKGIGYGRRPELVGGGLVRSMGGWEAVSKAKKNGEWQQADERILGGSDFVEQALRAVEEKEKKASQLLRKGWTPEKVLQHAAAIVGVEKKELCRPGRRPRQYLGRWLACKWLVEDLQCNGVEVAKLMGISRSAVSYGVQKGVEKESELGVSLEEEGDVFQ